MGRSLVEFPARVKGRRILTGMLMGSVSHKVANHTGATCIAVK